MAIPITETISAGIKETEILLGGLEQALSKLEIRPELRIRVDTMQKLSKEESNYANIRI